MCLRMDNVIGFKGDSDERQVNWNSMRLLRTACKADKYLPDKQRAYHKEKSLYQYFLETYVDCSN